MNWEELGAIGELLSAIAVFVTIGFLAIQMRQFSRNTAANTIASYMESYSAVNGRAASSAELARIVRIGHKNPSELNEDESSQFFYHLASFLSLWESIWRLHSQGLVTEEHWKLVRADIVTAFSSPGGRQFLDNVLPIFENNSPALAAELKLCRDETPLLTGDWNSVGESK